jgi:DNA end-binding protein Ku
VSVPVNLLAATRSDRTALRMVTQEGTPLNRRYYAPSDDRPLEWDDIVRGYEVEKDRYVVVEDDELERLAPERTRDIDLRVFVKASDIAPIQLERAYYLVPGGESTKAYRLLAQVMEEGERAGIATFVMRDKEYLVAITAENGILRAETLRFADEIRTPESIGLPEPQKPPAAQVKRFVTAIEKKKAARFDEKDLVDRSAERLIALARKKAKKGEDVHKVEPQRRESREVIDLMEMLQRSLAGKVEPGDAGRAGAKRASDDTLSKQSKADLYRQAQKLDIPGRSEMSKEELIEAIRRSA